MKKRRAAMLCAVSLLCFGIFLGQALCDWWSFQSIHIPDAEKVLGIYLVEDTDFLQDKNKKIPTDNIGVALEKIQLPYDKSTNTLYLAQSLEEWSGVLSVLNEEAYVLCSPDISEWGNRQDAVKEGHVFTLWAVGAQDYYEYQLVISGMPIISMTTERIEEQEKVSYEADPDKLHFGSETLHYGTISVFNPDIGTDSYEILQSNLCYYLKGGSTKAFEKKAYSLKLQDYQGKNINVSLLGMRADSTWKLNALYTDTSRVREKTASQIWEQIDEANTGIKEPGPRMEYAELILDGEYKGLYCLVEPVDEKKLELDKEDILYKIIDWQVPEDVDIQDSVNMGWKIQYPVRIRYPKEIKDYGLTWQPMREYLNTFYRSEAVDFDAASQKVNIDNLMDYMIFTMVTTASDNTYKNIYYTAYRQEDGSYRMQLIPWDLDCSFGNIWAIDEVTLTYFDSDYTKVYIEDALPLLKKANPEAIDTTLLAKWNEYRADFLRTENVLQLLEDNRAYIIDTGAAAREAERWLDAGVNMDIEALLDFQTKRMEWLDGYFTEGIK